MDALFPDRDPAPPEESARTLLIPSTGCHHTASPKTPEGLVAAHAAAARGCGCRTNLSSSRPGGYTLQIRKAGLAWSYYPLVVTTRACSPLWRSAYSVSQR